MVRQCQISLIRVITGQEMVREKILQGQGKVRKFYFESGKTEKQFHIPMMAERNISGHCDRIFFLSRFVKTIVEMP